MRRVDPDALYNWCRMIERDLGILDKQSMALTAVFTEVAEPEHDPYCMAGSVPCRKCRERAKAAAEQPAEPVIDEAVYEAAQSAYALNWRGEAFRSAITAAILKDRELRSKACGGSSSGTLSSAGSSSGGQSGPTNETSAAAPAADPRRLTDQEMMFQFANAYQEAMRKDLRGEAFILSRLRAVADTQLAKARVTISEEEIGQNVSDCLSEYGRTRWMIALLRRHGVEVTK